MKPLLEQWFDDYWLLNIEAHAADAASGKISNIEEKVESLVEMLLELGDEQLQVLRQNKNLRSPLTGRSLNNYDPVKENQRFKHDYIITHRAHVNAVMLAIKPGFIKSFCHFLYSYFQPYNKPTIYQYLKKIRNTDVIQYSFGVPMAAAKFYKKRGDGGEGAEKTNNLIDSPGL